MISAFSVREQADLAVRTLCLNVSSKTLVFLNLCNQEIGGKNSVSTVVKMVTFLKSERNENVTERVTLDTSKYFKTFHEQTNRCVEGLDHVRFMHKGARVVLKSDSFENCESCARDWNVTDTKQM